MSCVQHLHSEVTDSRSLIVRQPPSDDAPFGFESSNEIRIINNTLRFQEEIADFNPDIVYVAGWGNRDYNQLAKTYRKRGIPVICGMDNHWKGTLKQWLGVGAARWKLHSRFTHIWVPGLAQYEFAKKLGFKPGQILQHLYVADVKRYAVDEVAVQKRFLFVGRLVDHKGVDILLAAFKEVYEQARDWRLCFIGNGEYSRQINNQDGCELIPFMQPEDLPAELQKGGVFVLPSRYEAWGVAIHEAALSGLPIISTYESGAASKFLINGYNGYKIRGGNVTHLVSSMKKIGVKTDKELIEMGMRSRDLGKTLTTRLWSAEFLSVLK